MKPTVSTVKTLCQLLAEASGTGADIQIDPTKNGRKNHVLVLMIWKRCRADESAKMTMKIIDVGREGS
jgi:hypothetical protein